MNRFFVICFCFVFSVLVLSVDGASAPTLALNMTYVYSKNLVHVIENHPMAWWKSSGSGNTSTILTQAWILQPVPPNKTAMQYQKTRITFGSDCYQALSVSNAYFNPSLRFLVYASGIATISPNITDESFSGLPPYAYDVSKYNFTNSSSTFSIDLDGGEVYLGFDCCLALLSYSSTGEYKIIQNNVSKCTVTVEGIGDPVYVPSYRLFWGIVVLFLVPSLLAGFIHCCCTIANRNEDDKNDARLRVSGHECRCFFILWFALFAVFFALIVRPIIS